MAQRLAALITFDDSITYEEAREALESIGHVLVEPHNFTEDPTPPTVGDLVRSYDDDFGGPVWYVP
jgi:hypothetical protein